MFTKYAIALSALLLIGGTSISSAFEAPENKIGDRYPFLEQPYPTTHGTTVARSMTMPKAAASNQSWNEAPENKIGDRYPLLEQPIQVAGTRQKSVARSTSKVQPLTLAEKAVFDRQSMRAVF